MLVARALREIRTDQIVLETMTYPMVLLFTLTNCAFAALYLAHLSLHAFSVDAGLRPDAVPPLLRPIGALPTTAFLVGWIAFDVLVFAVFAYIRSRPAVVTKVWARIAAAGGEKVISAAFTVCFAIFCAGCVFAFFYPIYTQIGLIDEQNTTTHASSVR
jgi:hypothetical protein